jgi:hypothetical protein
MCRQFYEEQTLIGDTDMTPTFIITMNYVVFSNYNGADVSVFMSVMSVARICLRAS